MTACSIIQALTMTIDTNLNKNFRTGFISSSRNTTITPISTRKADEISILNYDNDLYFSLPMFL
jgi:hypothetical protein